MEDCELPRPESKDDRQDDVDGKLGDLLVHTVNFGQHNRIYIIALAMSLILDVVLSVALGFVAIDARRTSHKAKNTASVANINCLAANESRHIQILLWTHILDLPPTTSRTVVQEQQALEFRNYITTAFADRDCSKF